MDKDGNAPVLEFWLTREQWVQFTRVMELCHRTTGGPVGPAECLELLCRSYLERRRHAVGQSAPRRVALQGSDVPA
jgi:hypothetical protein